MKADAMEHRMNANVSIAQQFPLIAERFVGRRKVEGWIVIGWSSTGLPVGVPLNEPGGPIPLERKYVFRLPGGGGGRDGNG